MAPASVRESLRAAAPAEAAIIIRQIRMHRADYSTSGWAVFGFMGLDLSKRVFLESLSAVGENGVKCS